MARRSATVRCKWRVGKDRDRNLCHGGLCSAVYGGLWLESLPRWDVKCDLCVWAVPGTCAMVGREARFVGERGRISCHDDVKSPVSGDRGNRSVRPERSGIGKMAESQQNRSMVDCHVPCMEPLT